MMESNISFYLWIGCYVLVVLGLSSYGLHRYFVIYLYQKTKRTPQQPREQFEKLPRVTVQLPISTNITLWNASWKPSAS